MTSIWQLFKHVGEKNNNSVRRLMRVMWECLIKARTFSLFWASTDPESVIGLTMSAEAGSETLAADTEQEPDYTPDAGPTCSQNPQLGGSWQEVTFVHTLTMWTFQSIMFWCNILTHQLSHVHYLQRSILLLRFLSILQWAIYSIFFIDAYIHFK